MCECVNVDSVERERSALLFHMLDLNSSTRIDDIAVEQSGYVIASSMDRTMVSRSICACQRHPWRNMTFIVEDFPPFYKPPDSLAPFLTL